MKQRSTLGMHRGLSLVFIALFVIIAGAAIIAEQWKNLIDEQLGTHSSVIITKEIEGESPSDAYMFLADYENTDQLVQAHREMAYQLSAEGSVLLKNDGGLPLGDGSRVTLLGMRSFYSQYGGQIGSVAPEGQNVSLPDALRAAGFSVNETVEATYTHFGEIVTGQMPFFGGMVDVYGYQPGTLRNSFTVGSSIPSLAINEPAVDLLTGQSAEFESSFTDFSDAAIVVFGRPSTEASDFFPGEAGMENEGARNILGLTTNERAILNEATANFDTVVVLINSDNAMELGELQDNPDVDAILWVGAPGNYGFEAVADILNGNISPSGKLPDVYASDSTSSPAMQNFGIFEFANTDEIEPGGTTEYRGNWYLVEAEGIYTGYRYYETRYADAVAGQGNADSTAGTFDSQGAWNYAQEVTYPFGYGLSYTSFAQKLDGVEIANNKKTATVWVTVENTGSVAGKDVVQLYAQAPYISGGIEKSAVQLLDFSKTPLLGPGESVQLQIDVDMQLLASYDHINAKTYVLDAGEYFFALGADSHDALNNILAANGYSVSDGMTALGNSELTYRWSWDDFDDTTFAISQSGTPVTNQLDDADLNNWIPGSVTNLSRSDWEATWPKSYVGIVANDALIHQLRNDTYDIKEDQDHSVVWGQDSELSFADMKGADFDDYRWQELIESVDIDDAIQTISMAQNIILAMPSIEFFDVYVNDGPMGFHGTLSNRSKDGTQWYVSKDDPNAEYETRDVPTEVVIAATFNKELVRELGRLFGNDSIFNGQSIIWAPGTNTHRTPYNGRNHEYFSEDPVLTGYLAREITQGALEKGLIASVKHLAFNDQETNRAALAPFMTEQRAREIELRAFQIPLEAGARGIMTSFTRIGATYVNAHRGLMNNIVADEWGFRGYIVTDFINGAHYMTLKEPMMANVTNYDIADTSLLEEGGAWSYFNAKDISGDGDFQKQMQKALHNQLWAVANSNAMNGISTSSHRVWQLTWWRAVYIGLLLFSGALAMWWMWKYLRAYRRQEI